MSTTGLKLLALILMVVDHVGEFIPGMPMALRWIGRLSAPVFLFCSMWGFRLTRNRKAYLRRMYLCSVGMAAANYAMNTLFPNAPTEITNNFFSTILVVCVFVGGYEQLIKDKKNGGRAFGQLILLQIISMLLVPLAAKTAFLPLQLLVQVFLPNPLTVEGGPLWVVIGLVLYFCKEDKRKLIAGFGGLCVLYFLVCAGIGFGMVSYYASQGILFSLSQYMLYSQYGWMMIASLPLMLLFNGERGREMKAFFYAFYPAHIYGLFLLSMFY